MRVYVASKATHAEMWRTWRAVMAEHGITVVSTWIDEDETGSMADLWTRCIDEAADADVLIAWYSPGEEWKGAFIEIGAALAGGADVYVCGNPPGSWKNHPNVTMAENPDDALLDAGAFW